MRKIIFYILFFIINLPINLWAEDPLFYLNYIRQKAGLISLSENPLLNKAALNHARYLVAKGIISHFEEQGPYFTGETPGDRLDFVRYAYNYIFENISQGDKSWTESIDYLLAGIYHRCNFLSFKIQEIGLARIDNIFVYELALPTDQTPFILNNPSVIKWPEEGTVIPPGFYFEEPDPLPDIGVSGYPISIHFNPFRVKEVKLKEVHLYQKEKEKSLIIFTQKNDPNNILSAYDFFFIPEEHLGWGKTYQIEAVFEVDKQLRRFLWEFQTKSLVNTYYIITEKEVVLPVKSDIKYDLYFPPLHNKDFFDQYQIIHSPNVEVSTQLLDLNTLEIKVKGTIGQSATIILNNQHRVKLIISSQDQAIEPEQHHPSCLSCPQQPPQGKPVTKFISPSTGMLTWQKNLSLYINYYAPVYILAGVISCDFREIKWLDLNGCQWKKDLSLVLSDTISCEDIPPPFESGYGFVFVINTQNLKNYNWDEDYYLEIFSKNCHKF